MVVRQLGRLTLLLLFLALAPLAPAAQSAASLAPTAISIQDTPVPLATGVSSYTLVGPKLFWHTDALLCPPAGQGAQVTAGETERIRRVATYGSLERTLYSAPVNCDQGKVNSNIVADENYVYWLQSNGLFRLSVNANPGDPPQLVNALVSSVVSDGELADGGDRIYTFTRTSNSLNKVLGYVRKDNNQLVSPLTTTATTAGNLQTDGAAAYFVNSGALIRVNGTTSVVTQLTTSVSGYYPEGQRLLFCSINPVQCFFSDNIYVAKGANVYIYNNKTNTLGASPIYTAGQGVTVEQLVTDFSKLFVFESSSCGFICSNYQLNRLSRSGGTASPLYAAQNIGARRLTTDGTYLFWQEGRCCGNSQIEAIIQRIANDASALPQINLRVTGMEVTQAVQNLTNSVRLVKGKRTFVRLYVQSDGAAVSGVTATLAAPALGFGATLVPVNPAGTTITVVGAPNRNSINQSFLFELPWNWTQQSSLALRADLNPYHAPLEPNYGDNSSSVTASFSNSPQLSVQFFRLNYPMGGSTQKPRISADILKTYSWIMRAYPIGGSIGQNFKPTLWDVDGGSKLAGWVNRTSSDCDDVEDDQDDRALCASYYTNGWLNYYREHGWVPNTTSFYYGMIADTGGFFPRGQALYNKTSVGPSGTPCSPFSLGCGWDTDGSYADWYAGHEIGHSLGRNHPSPSASLCGNSASDAGYPYANGQLSSGAATYFGFDAGDGGFGIAKAVYPGTSWYDVMSYCSNQWISNYTYEGMYSAMIANPSEPPADARPRLQVAGDFLSVAGVINATAGSGGFARVQRTSSVASIPPIAPGGYTIQQLNAQGNVLTSAGFTPHNEAESDLLGFSQVLNFALGARSVRVVRDSDSKVLMGRAISANPPSISNVALQGAPNPVSGVVTLGWTASDPDGDALTFDIFYSRDGGATFQPAKMGATGSSTTLDTATLGGSGNAILRVVASDGVNTAAASSAPFVMGSKPPEPFILTPANPTHIQYGQLVNFSGVAFDVQDTFVADAGLVWKDAGGNVLGNGAQISLDALPVGTNVITLVATNSQGKAASATVTVVVGDDLALPGPTLSAGPGQVGWHVAAGATAAQVAQISIGNTGSGTLSWAVSSDQPWLTPSVGSGSVPAGDNPFTLTISAAPGALAPGKPHFAKLTITNMASPAQKIVIPVSLSIGDVWNNVSLSGVGLYLPVARK